jgi:hypothetical protein
VVDTPPSRQETSLPPPPEHTSPPQTNTVVATSDRPRAASKTVKLTDLLKTDPKKEEKQSVTTEKIQEEAFTPDQLRAAWMEFADQRKKFQAEYQMLSQPYEIRGKQIVVTLLSPVHETMLNNIKVEMTTFLRDKLKNSSIQVTGELLQGDAERKIIYTNKEKFDYLAEKNPMLRELKDRLGLDTDF